MTESVTRLRAPLVEDRYGAQVRDWDDATSTTVTECVVAPRLEPEDTGNGRHGVLIGYTVYAPPGTDIVVSDRVTARGDECEVDGQPAVWTDPFSNVTEGLEVKLRTVNG